MVLLVEQTEAVGLPETPWAETEVLPETPRAEKVVLPVVVLRLVQGSRMSQRVTWFWFLPEPVAF